MIDLAFDVRGRDLVIPIKPIDGAARVRQAISIHLKTWLGEWFLDTSHGVPYLENILGKNKRPEIVEAILRAEILKVEGVKSIKSFTMLNDQRTRQISITFSAESREGLVSGNLSLG
jgi:hypothetical protein